MTDDLLTAVDDLTLSKPVKVPTDTGHTWAREEALLVQLQEAVSSSIGGTAGGRSAPWTRNVLDSDALHQAGIITAQIGDWCRIAGAKVSRDPVVDLRAWYVAQLSRDDTSDFYLLTLLKWAGQIRAMLAPPKTLEITSPCPVCDQGVYTNDMGETVSHPLVMTYPADDPFAANRAKALCRACNAVWEGGEAMAELRDELFDKEAG